MEPVLRALSGLAVRSGGQEGSNGGRARSATDSGSRLENRDIGSCNLEWPPSVTASEGFSSGGQHRCCFEALQANGKRRQAVADEAGRIIQAQANQNAKQVRRIA